MNRLCIYVTYNKENKIYEYIAGVLKSLKSCCSKICLVCNYEKIITGMELISPYVDYIFYRNNKGYDSGAFKDVLCDLLGWGEVDQYDELILANDSFFGFFYSLENTIRLMGGNDCDFWGMTGQSAGEFTNPYYSFDAHIHSYFLVFKKNVLRSKVFKNFWEELRYPVTFREAVVSFELGINCHLQKYGFQGKSYIDIYNLDLKRNENPDYSRLYDLIHDYKIPIMKKKCVLIRNTGFTDTLKTIQFLKEEGRYPINWIKVYLENQFYISGTDENPCNSLEIFYHNHSDIYIYGAGVCGKNLAVYFDYKGWDFKGFLVTDNTAADVPAMDMKEAEITENTGIIIAVISEKVSREIAEHIGDRCTEEQMFFLSDCSAVRIPV